MAHVSPHQELNYIGPHFRHIGVTQIEAADGRAEVTVSPLAETSNVRGDVHGGIIAAIMDIAVTRAVRAADPKIWGLATISLTVNYLEPGRGTLVARGRTVRSGKTIAIAEAEIQGEGGAPVARASAVLRVIRNAPKRET